MVVVRGSISLTTRHRPHGHIRRHRSRIAQRKKRQHQRPDESKPADPCHHSFDDKAVFLQIKARCQPGKFERRYFLSARADYSTLTRRTEFASDELRQRHRANLYDLSLRFASEPANVIAD
jgi:hypothetical protein